MPALRSRRARPRLNSGASMPTKTSSARVEECCAQPRAQAQQARQMAQRLDQAHHRELLERAERLASRREHARTRDADELRSSGRRSRSAAISAAPSRSPEASPATRPMRSGAAPVTVSGPGCASPCAMKSTKMPQLGLLRRHVAQLRDRLLELEVAAIQHPVGVLMTRICSSVKPRRFRPSMLTPARLGRMPGGEHIRRHVARHRGVVADEGMRADLGRTGGRRHSRT